MMNKIYFLLAYSLFFFGMLVSGAEQIWIDGVRVDYLPSWLSSISVKARWGVMILTSLIVIVKFPAYRRYFNICQWRYVLFYAVLFFFSLCTGDMVRYSGLFCFTIAIPLFFAAFIDRIGQREFFKGSYLVVIAVTLIGLYCSVTVKGLSLRYTGWVGNPNMFVALNIFFIVLVLNTVMRHIFSPFLVYPLLFFLILAQLSAGSRNGLISLALVFSVFLYMQKRNLTKIVFYVILLGTAVMLFTLFGPEDSTRIWQIKSAIEDSGRGDLWSVIWPYIQEKPLLGWGCVGKQLIGMDQNFHNSFLVLLFFTGIPIGSFLIGLFAYASFRSPIVSNPDEEDRNTSMLFGAYLIGYTLCSFGEDFLIGVGNPTFIQFLFSIGVLLQIHAKQHRIQYWPEHYEYE